MQNVNVLVSANKGNLWLRTRTLPRTPGPYDDIRFLPCPTGRVHSDLGTVGNLVYILDFFEFIHHMHV